MPNEVQTVTIKGVEWKETRYDQKLKREVPSDHPRHIITCDGLPGGKNNFSIFPGDEAVSAEDFLINHTYKISGFVQMNGYFKATEFISEVENAKPRVDGVPKDREMEILKGAVGHDAATITAALIAQPSVESSEVSPAVALATYKFVYEDLLAYRLGDNHQTEAKEGPMGVTGPPGEEYPPE